MKNSFFLTLLMLVLIGGGCFSQQSKDSSTGIIDRASILSEARQQGLIMDDAEISSMSAATVDESIGQNIKDIEKYFDLDLRDWRSGALADVTGGGSFGLVYTQYENGQFTAFAKLGGLPTPADGYFYEGWLVRRGNNPLVVSTGKAIIHDENWYGNVFISSTDLSGYNFYVLTLEPDDGNPASSEHILEGIIK